MASIVETVSTVDDELCAALGRLLPQLTPRHAMLDRQWLTCIVHSPAVRLMVARKAKETSRIAGTATLVLVPLPTGLRCRLEDVVVDEAARGRGVGRALVREAVAHARSAGARDLDLTVPPHRSVAIGAYESAGFERIETYTYRHWLRAAAADSRNPHLSGPQ